MKSRPVAFCAGTVRSIQAVKTLYSQCEQALPCVTFPVSHPAPMQRWFPLFEPAPVILAVLRQPSGPTHVVTTPVPTGSDDVLKQLAVNDLQTVF